MNVVSEYKRKSIEELLERGVGLREIARRLVIDRSTVRRVAKQFSKPPTPSTGSEGGESQNHPPCRPALTAVSKLSVSESAPHREWIEKQVDLGRNAMSIYQDLVEMHGFSHKYSSVQRFVKGLKRRNPERFDFLEYGPGEEAQVDYGEGAPTLQPNGKWKKPYLFVMTLKYSGKSFRRVVWKTSQEVWAKLHEEAFRAFGGCTKYVVLDNLKEGVIKPDLYEPELNKVYAAVWCSSSRFANELVEKYEPRQKHLRSSWACLEPFINRQCQNAKIWGDATAGSFGSRRICPIQTLRFRCDYEVSPSNDKSSDNLGGTAEGYVGNFSEGSWYRNRANGFSRGLGSSGFVAMNG